MPRKPKSEQKNVPFPVREDQILVGAKLRSMRQSRGLSMEQIAGAIGVNKSFVSKLEHDTTSASVSTLVKYCDALGVPIGRLFDQPRTNLVRKDDRRRIDFGGVKLNEYVISGSDQENFLALYSEVEPGGGSGLEPYTLRSAADMVHILEGQLVITVGDDKYELGIGDTLTFPPSAPHSWHNPSESQQLRAIWIISPPP